MTPWWNIPRFAQPGGRRAFVNREFLLTDLAQRIIGAGNSLRGGSTSVRERIALTGYRGVGKSALMLQALAMLRAPSRAVDGAAVKLPPTLPTPSEPERWVIIRVSGKSVGSFQELPNALESRALKDVIEDECRLRYSPRVTRLVMKLADALPVELLRAALEHEPVEAAQLALGDPDRRELIRHGLLTPVSASEQDGAVYYLDPLLATAGLARRRVREVVPKLVAEFLPELPPVRARA